MKLEQQLRKRIVELERQLLRQGTVLEGLEAMIIRLKATIKRMKK